MLTFEAQGRRFSAWRHDADGAVYILVRHLDGSWKLTIRPRQGREELHTITEDEGRALLAAWNLTE